MICSILCMSRWELSGLLLSRQCLNLFSNNDCFPQDPEVIDINSPLALVGGLKCITH